eukprot:15218490-Ditylum_brightwellii.AAC.1
MGKAKKHKPFSKEDAEAYGAGLKNYFGVVQPKKQRGRPKKSKGRGRPKNTSPPTPPPHTQKSLPEIATTTADVGEDDKDADVVVEDNKDDNDDT